jgi:hypothetical protein
MINATWHRQHPMPPRATADQRLRWHLTHAKACGCRKLTAAQLAELRRKARQMRPRR